MSVLRVERWLPMLVGLSMVVLQLGSHAGGPPAAVPSSPSDEPGLQPLAANVATWPTSSGLLVAEVVTRGAAASDQYVEIYNAAQESASLAGLELVYVTASGATVTRKQSWTDLQLPARHHLLVANAAGSFAPLADGLFSGGFSTAGGSLVLRTTSGGVVIDALSWGTAASAFVEGVAGPAPPSGSSLERLPGGQLGNSTDTNDNLLDTHLQPQPEPRNLAAGAVHAGPGPSAAPSASATAGPATPAPSEPTAPASPPWEDDPPGDDPEELPDPTSTPTDDPQRSQAPVATQLAPSPLPSATPGPSPSTGAEPTPPPSDAPLPSPSAAPTLSPQPSAPPLPPAIAELRAMPLGSTVTAHGWLTAPLGISESGKGAFIEDGTAGVGLYLATGTWPAAPTGSAVLVSGVLETRFSLLTLRVANVDQLVIGTAAPLPDPMTLSVNEVGEAAESRLVTVEGTVSDGISALSDGFSTAVDDGTGSLRVIVATATGIDPAELARGRHVRLTGVVGQRDSSGTGLAGYRLHLRSPADVEDIVAPPSPAPSTPPPAASPTPGSTSSPSPTPSPALSLPPTAPPASPLAIALARQLPIGQRALVQGTVTARPGRILGDRTACLQDASAGICVRLPDGVSAAAGDVLLVDGLLAAPYGNLELRPTATGVSKVGSAALPPARLLATAELGESTEGLLALVKGTVTTASASSNGVITVMIQDDSGEGRIYVHAPLGMSRDQFPRGRRLSVYGIVGDRLGLYRLWPRDAGDFVAGGNGPANPSPAPGGTPPAGATPPPGTSSPTTGATPAPSVGIGEALRRAGQKVTVDGVVSAPSGLLDADGRRLTIQDGSGAILLRLPPGAQAPSVGQRLRVTGEVGTYYGAPQLAAADAPTVLGTGSVESLRVARAPIPASAEWRLATVSGTVESLTRSGDAWRAEIAVEGGTIPIVGLGRSAIPPDMLVKGRIATVTGIVRRAYPTATDQRLALVPRSRTDVSVGGASGSGPGGSPGPDPLPTEPTLQPGASPAAPGASPAPGQGSALAISLSELAAHEGRLVQVGGRIERFSGELVLIGDGTAVAALLLGPDARAFIVRLRPGLLVNATGVVVRLEQGGLAVRVEQAGDLLVGGVSLGGATAAPTPARTAASADESAQPLPDGAGSEVGRAADWPAVLLGLLVVMGAVTGSATAFFVRQPRHRAALRLALTRVKAALWRRHASRPTLRRP